MAYFYTSYPCPVSPSLPHPPHPPFIFILSLVSYLCNKLCSECEAETTNVYQSQIQRQQYLAKAKPPSPSIPLSLPPSFLLPSLLPSFLPSQVKALTLENDDLRGREAALADRLRALQRALDSRRRSSAAATTVEEDGVESLSTLHTPRPPVQMGAWPPSCSSLRARASGSVAWPGDGAAAGWWEDIVDLAEAELSGRPAGGGGTGVAGLREVLGRAEAACAEAAVQAAVDTAAGLPPLPLRAALLAHTIEVAGSISAARSAVVRLISGVLALVRADALPAVPAAVRGAGAGERRSGCHPRVRLFARMLGLDAGRLVPIGADGLAVYLAGLRMLPPLLPISGAGSCDLAVGGRLVKLSEAVAVADWLLSRAPEASRAAARAKLTAASELNEELARMVDADSALELMVDSIISPPSPAAVAAAEEGGPGASSCAQSTMAAHVDQVQFKYSLVVKSRAL